MPNINNYLFTPLILASLCLALPLNTMAAGKKQCSATSSPSRTVLLELFTSEGCSSCPPADKALSDMGKRADLRGKLIPLSLHVDYWNYLGWKDPFSSAQFTQRQRSYARIWRSGTIYTPQFVVSGMNTRPGLLGYNLSSSINTILKQASPADIRIQLQNRPGNRLHISASGALKKSITVPGKVLYVAIYENGLQRQVVRGENRGRLLKHDHVVRRLFDAIRFNARGRAAFAKLVSIPGGWQRKSLGIVAFVQDRNSGKVLQALSLPLCQ